MYMGIPTASVPVARALTLSGYAGAVAHGARARGASLHRANIAFQTALNSGPIDASRNEMHRTTAALAWNNQYRPSLAGLGDDIDEINDIFDSGYFNEDVDETEPPNNAEGGSWWTDVLRTFAGQLGVGVAGRIAGQNPWAKPPVLLAPPEMPAAAKFALVGVAVLGGAYVLTRVMAKR